MHAIKDISTSYQGIMYLSERLSPVVTNPVINSYAISKRKIAAPKGVLRTPENAL